MFEKQVLHWRCDSTNVDSAHRIDSLDEALDAQRPRVHWRDSPRTARRLCRFAVRWPFLGGAFASRGCSFYGIVGWRSVSVLRRDGGSNDPPYISVRAWRCFAWPWHATSRDCVGTRRKCRRRLVQAGDSPGPTGLDPLACARSSDERIDAMWSRCRYQSAECPVSEARCPSCR